MASLRVILVVYCLRGGGAERVSAYLANSLADRGYRVTVVTELGPETDQYQLRADVARAVIGRANGGGRLRKMGRFLAKTFVLRQIVKRLRPDVVVSFMTRSNNISLLATTRLPVKTIVCERNDPRHNKERSVDANLRRWSYPRADLLIVQTDTMARVMREEFGVEKSVTIPNPSLVDIDEADQTPEITLPENYILAMGRLAPQKGFDVLIRAYARSRALHLYELVIAGQGGHLGWYESIAREEGVLNRVRFVGHLERPLPVMKRCRMFVLSSRWEGFPNVLLEAMSLRRPVISSRLPSGAHDMIVDGVSGLLVPVGDEQALVTAINRLVDDPAGAEAMGNQGPAAVARFRLPVVMDQWAEVLSGTATAGKAA